MINRRQINQLVYERNKGVPRIVAFFLSREVEEGGNLKGETGDLKLET